MIANQQKQILLSMLGGNSEQQIASIIQGAIDNYTDQLEKLHGITIGGEGAFNGALEKMWNSQWGDILLLILRIQQRTRI